MSNSIDWMRGMVWWRSAYVAHVGLFGGAAVVLFFSSRRRHTRCSRDWSSDVCSSDLRGLGGRLLWRLLLRARPAGADARLAAGLLVRGPGGSPDVPGHRHRLLSVHGPFRDRKSVV